MCRGKATGLWNGSQGWPVRDLDSAYALEREVLQASGIDKRTKTVLKLIIDFYEWYGALPLDLVNEFVAEGRAVGANVVVPLVCECGLSSVIIRVTGVASSKSHGGIHATSLVPFSMGGAGFRLFRCLWPCSWMIVGWACRTGGLCGLGYPTVGAK